MSKTIDNTGNTNPDKLVKIESMVRNFCVNHLNPEIESYCLKLFDTLSRKRIINIRRGKEEIWAASIIYTIARLNFLFDKENENFITADIICDFFGTKKSTIGNKATQIEKACKLTIGVEGYCSKRITDSFTFYRSPEGFIFPKSMIQEREIIFEVADEKVSEELRMFTEELKNVKERKQIEKKKKREETNRKIAENKKKKDSKTFGKQLSIFDDI